MVVQGWVLASSGEGRILCKKSNGERACARMSCCRSLALSACREASPAAAAACNALMRLVAASFSACRAVQGSQKAACPSHTPAAFLRLRVFSLRQHVTVHAHTVNDPQADSRCGRLPAAPWSLYHALHNASTSLHLCSRCLRARLLSQLGSNTPALLFVEGCKHLALT